VKESERDGASMGWKVASGSEQRWGCVIGASMGVPGGELCGMLNMRVFCKPPQG
jgi:hypothetical protein